MNRKGRNRIKIEYRNFMRQRLMHEIKMSSKSHVAICCCHGYLPPRTIKRNQKVLAELFGAEFPAIALVVSLRRRLPGFPIRRRRKTAG